MSQLKPQEIKPVHNPVFQTMDSLEDILEMARLGLEEGKMTPNRFRSLFGIYHNTLIAKLTHQAEHR